MPRDDLTIAAHFPNMPPGLPDHGAIDPITVLEDFVARSANLPAEIQYMREEMDDKERQLQLCMDGINVRDQAIQKFIKLNGSLAPNTKHARLVKEAIDLYDRAQILQEEKHALAIKTQQTVDRQIRFLDHQLDTLQKRGEFPADNDIPSLLRPQEPTRALTASTLAAQAGRMTAQQQAQRLGQQQQANSAPATPAAALMLQRQQRESSAGAASASNKRQRMGVGLNIPVTSSNLARHASTGPGTPKAGSVGGVGTPGTSRAGSAGPRAGQKTQASGKKVAPHKQGAASANRSKIGKSGLSRVKGARSGNKASPSASTADSDLSDAGSGEDDEHTPPPGERKDEEMEEDEGSDDRKYCMCQKVSYGDMVACDNPDCAYEWFHWPCVGLTKEPVGTWICPPCSERMIAAGGRKR